MVIVGVSIGAVSATVAGVGLASGSPTSSVYSSITPVTVLGRSLAADSNTDVVVAGVDSVPSNATSVQLSVTALSGTTTSSMYVYPTGATKPTSANVRWQTGETVTIPVTVAVGTGAKIRLTTDGGTVTVKVAIVGYFSPASAPGSSGYGTTATNVNLTTIGNGYTTVASLVVPAGTYEVLVKADVVMNGGTSDAVDCVLTDPAANAIDYSVASVDADVSEDPMSMTGLDTTTGGTMTIGCYSYEGNSVVTFVRFQALKLSSASGVVTGS